MFFIFDFDCTITKNHLYHFLNNYTQFCKLYPQYNNGETVTIRSNYIKGSSDLKTKMDIIDIIFGGSARLNSILRMMNQIAKNNGIIYIASRGIKEQIVYFLQYCCPEILMTNGGCINEENIYGGKNKEYILSELCKISNVFYVDDDHSEHIAFTKGFTYSDHNGCNLYNIVNRYIFMNSLVKDVGGGLNDEHMHKIPNIFK